MESSSLMDQIEMCDDWRVFYAVLKESPRNRENDSGTKFDRTRPGTYGYGVRLGVSMENTVETKQKGSVKVQLEIEELEAKIAPKLAGNHNETLVRE